MSFLRAISALLLWLPTLQLVSSHCRAQPVPVKSFPMVDAAGEDGAEVPQNSLKSWLPSPIPISPHWLHVRMTGSSDSPTFIWGRNEQKIPSWFFFFNKDGVKATSWWACKVHTPQHTPPPNPPLFPAPRRKSCFLKMNLFLLKANISPPAYILQGLVMQQADWADISSLLLTAASVAVDKSIQSPFGSLKFTEQLIVWIEILNIYMMNK